MVPTEESAVRRSLLVLLALLLALAAAPPAHAGGFVTVGVDSTPAGTPPGEPWHAELTVLAHGRTPLDGMEPVVRITGPDTVHEVVAAPAGKPGVYRASVVFPRAGTWRYEVRVRGYDGQVTQFPPVEIGDGPVAATSGTATGAGDDGGIQAGWLWGAGAALLAALALLALDRRRSAGARGAAEPA